MSAGEGTVVLVDSRVGVREVIASYLRERITTNLRVVAISTPAELSTRGAGLCRVMIVVQGTCHAHDESAFPQVSQLRLRFPRCPILVICDVTNSTLVRNAFCRGADGMVSTQAPISVLGHALRVVLAGSKYLPARAVTAGADRLI